MKQVQRFAVAILVILASAPTASGADLDHKVLGVGDFSQIADHIHAYKPSDEFDDGPTFPTIAGLRFSITMNIRKSTPPNDCPGYPTWSYDAGDGTLSTELSDGFVFVDSWDERFTKIFPRNKNVSSGTLYFTSLICRNTLSSRYRASNAFGVSATVSRQKYRLVAISTQKQPTTEMIYPQSVWRDSVSGEEARHLSKSLALRITGTVGTWPNGESVLCGTEHLRPKLDFPYDTDTSVCVFKVNAVTYEVIDRSSGATLYKVEDYLMTD